MLSVVELDPTSTLLGSKAATAICENDTKENAMMIFILFMVYSVYLHVRSEHFRHRGYRHKDGTESPAPR